MPVVIGAKPESNFSDPIGLLTDCHRRIERFLAVLVRVATDARGGQLSGEQRVALDTALRYFRDAAPKHTADEESSLFPRLRASGQALTELDALHQDHDRADRHHAEIDRLGRTWLETGSLSPDDAARLSALVSELTELYRAHIAVEEGSVFPLASQVLAAEERVAMGKEMAGRRGV
jgi:hemerythrin-like domain-containing protein